MNEATERKKLSRRRLTCANCGEASTTPGQFVSDGRWVCCQSCCAELADAQSYEDLAASGGIAGEAKHAANDAADRLRRLEASHARLLAACKRLARAFEADVEQVPTLDVKTCWETNSQAIADVGAAVAEAEALAKKNHPTQGATHGH